MATFYVSSLDDDVDDSLAFFGWSSSPTSSARPRKRIGAFCLGGQKSQTLRALHSGLQYSILRLGTLSSGQPPGALYSGLPAASSGSSTSNINQDVTGQRPREDEAVSRGAETQLSLLW